MIRIDKKSLKSFRRYNFKDKTKSFINLYQRIVTSKFDKENFYQFSKALNSFSNLYAHLLKVYVYLKLDNRSRARYEIENILLRDFYQFLFDSDIRLMELGTQKEILTNLLEKIAFFLGEEQKFMNLLYYIAFYSEGELKELIEEKFSLKYSISYLREKYESFQYGRKFPFVWAPIIFETSSQVEYLKVLKLALMGKNVETGDPKYLMFFRMRDSVPRQQRESVLKLFKTLQNRKTFYEHELYYRMLEDASFKKFLSANGVGKTPILASSKRKFYARSLKRNKNPLYSIYNLLSLGDMNPEYTWQLLAFENSRL